MADIDTYKLLIKVVDSYPSIKEADKKIQFTLRRRLCQTILQGYILIPSPTIRFLRQTKTNFLESQEFYDENPEDLRKNINEHFTKEERIRLGLPVSFKEMELVLRKPN